MLFFLTLFSLNRGTKRVALLPIGDAERPKSGSGCDGFSESLHCWDFW